MKKGQTQTTTGISWIWVCSLMEKHQLHQPHTQCFYDTAQEAGEKEIHKMLQYLVESGDQDLGKSFSRDETVAAQS